MMCEMIRRNDLLRLSNEVIKPFYSQRVQETIAILRRYLPEERCLIHKPEGAIFLLKWFTEFGHLNRGDMLTSEQHRCHNEKISAQSLNANPLNWSLTRTTPWQMQPALWMSAFPQ